MNSELIGNRYRFVQPLGEGGFGKTFIAEDLQRPGNPKCVIKLLKSGNQQIAYRLFRQEAETLEILGNHEQIPRLLAYLEEEGEIYIVQELIRGNPLSAELRPNCPWEEKAVVEMLLDCLQVLDFVHGFQVIHRDIKPDNIIRRDDGRLVLVDFGTVKTAHTNPEQTVGIVSHGYTPDEQMSGRPRKSSDIYALGMIAIEALTSISPSRLEQDIDGEIIWRNQAPNVSTELADILSKMVKSYHLHRYQSVDQVFLDLAQLISNYSLPPISINQPKPLDPTQVIQPTANQLQSSEPTLILQPYENQPKQLDPTQVIQSTPSQPKQLDPTQVIQSIPSQPKQLDPTQVIQSIPNQPKQLDPTQVIQSTPSQPRQLDPTQVIQSTPNQPRQLDPTQVIQSTPNQPKQLDPTQVIQSTPNQPRQLDPTQVIQSIPNQPKQLDPTPSSKQIEHQPKSQKTAISIKIFIGVGTFIILIVLSVIAMKLFSPPDPPPKPIDPSNIDLCPGPLCPTELK